MAVCGMDIVATRSEKVAYEYLNFWTDCNNALLLSDCRKDHRPPLVLHVEMGSSTAGDLLRC